MNEFSSTVYPTQSLLKALRGTIADSEGSATHLRETEAFLNSIANHLDWYDEVLALLEQHGVNEEIVSTTIDEISKAIYQVVDPIKQLCEGTTDRIPCELAVLLGQELREATGMKDIRIALCPIPNLNFVYSDFGEEVTRLFQGLDSWLKANALPEIPENVIGEVGKRTPSPPRLPSSHILIAFQYALADDILFNSALFHEIGHHVLKITGLWSKYNGTIEQELDTDIKALFPDYKSQRESGSSEASKLLQTATGVCTGWVAEIFSDAFACALIGPQFGFAIRDLFRLKSKSRPVTFSTSHPADRVRQFAQSHVLKYCGWLEPPAGYRDDVFAKEVKEVFSELEVAGLDSNPKKWDVSSTWNVEPLKKINLAPVSQIILRAFFRHIKEVGETAATQVKDFMLRSAEFWALGPHVKKAFEKHAVVPSTLVIRDKLNAVIVPPRTNKVQLDEGVTETYTYFPSPSTIFNSTRLIIESGDNTIVRTCFPQAAVPFDRERMARSRQRLGDWTRKAIGDYNLLRGYADGP